MTDQLSLRFFIAGIALSTLLASCGGGEGGSTPISEPPITGSARDSTEPISRDELYDFACRRRIVLGVDAIEPAIYLNRAAERLTYLMDSNALSVAYRFNAGANQVIYHTGHLGAINEKLVDRLLQAGFTVIVFNMPLVGENTGPWATHDDMSSLCPFVEPVIRYLNDYGEAHMIGLSGGGWTTILAAAMDHRINKSISVSGSLPYDQRQPEDYGDFEQRELNRFADYREIYAMANEQVAIQNRYDSCCFSGTALREISIPGWRAIIDETHRKHSISDFAVDVILDVLRNSEPL